MLHHLSITFLDDRAFVEGLAEFLGDDTERAVYHFHALLPIGLLPSDACAQLAQNALTVGKAIRLP